MAPRTSILTVFVEASFRHLSCRETKAHKQRTAAGRRLASRAIVRHPHRPPCRPRDGVRLARRFAPVGLIFPDSLSRRFHARLFLLLALRPLRDSGRRAGEQPLLLALPVTPARGRFSRPPCPPATPGTLANGSANQKLDRTPVWALRQGYRWCRGFRQRTHDVWVHSLDMRGCAGWDRGPPDVSEFHPRALGMGPYLDTASFGWNRIKMKPHLMRAGPTPVTGVLTRRGRGGPRRAAGTMCGEDARGGGRGTRRRRSGRRGPRQAGAAGGPRGRGERPGQAGPQTPGGSRPRTPGSAVPRGGAERNVAARRSRSCRLTDQPTWDSLTQKGPPAPASPRGAREGGGFSSFEEEIKTASDCGSCRRGV